MKREEIVKGFVQLGKLMVSLGEGLDWQGFNSGLTEEEYLDLQGIINKQFQFNGWFTKTNVQKSLLALGLQLNEENLTSWLRDYSFTDKPKKVGIIMAGNLPLVGFHDFLCVLLSGNTAVCKLSSDDKTLLPALATQLIKFQPELSSRIIISEGRIGEIEAVIATGSGNSLKYFEQYFGKYPHIFRSNRTSLAIITGNESESELDALGHDIFDYFGLGCRNVSHLLVPEGYKLDHFFGGIVSHSEVINHNKYGNNYDYNRAIFLMNSQPFLDNNFVLLKESDDLFSPLAVINYSRYKDDADITSYLDKYDGFIQVIVGPGYIPFGQAQTPSLNDYADGMDTMRFLESL